jgi:hypothetical protein
MESGLKTICEQLRREPLNVDSMVDYIWHSGHLRVLKVRCIPRRPSSFPQPETKKAEQNTN